jgi:hypothetical protein
VLSFLEDTSGTELVFEVKDGRRNEIVMAEVAEVAEVAEPASEST